MKVNLINTMHMEYRDRFETEFDFLVQQSTFAKLTFLNRDVLFADEEAPFVPSLRNLFGCSFEGMVLCLARVWDQDDRDLNLISIPNLIFHFARYEFLGCLGLRDGEADRVLYDRSFSHLIRARLRTARTEILAHSLRIGTSKDRQKSDIQTSDGFELVNGEVLSFCEDTMQIMHSLNRQLQLAGRFHNATLEEMKARSRRDHIQLFRCLVQNIEDVK